MTDLRMGKIGHGLGPRATLPYDDSIFTTNLRNCAEALQTLINTVNTRQNCASGRERDSGCLYESGYKKEWKAAAA